MSSYNSVYMFSSRSPLIAVGSYIFLILFQKMKANIMISFHYWWFCCLATINMYTDCVFLLGISTLYCLTILWIYNAYFGIIISNTQQEHMCFQCIEAWVLIFWSVMVHSELYTITLKGLFKKPRSRSSSRMLHKKKSANVACNPNFVVLRILKE